MKKDLNQISIRTAAITAGIAILIMTIAATIANDVSIGKLVIDGNASATYKSIVASEGLFRVGVYSWIVILISDLFVAWGLYIYFRSVNQDISLVAAWFRLVYTAILGTAIACLIYVLLILGNESLLTAMGTETLQAQVIYYINAFYSIWNVGLIIFGFHILFIGYLIIKSRFVPNIFGVLLLLAFVGYVLTNSSNILFPQFEATMVYLDWIFLLPMLAEVAFGIWLLIKGMHVQT